jgi:tetratricopeptide (TPR) repeat protein
MLWTDVELPPQIPLDVHLRLQRESVTRRPHDPARHAKLGELLLQLAMYNDAAAALEQAEALCPGDFRHFAMLAKCYVRLDRPEAALQACERGSMRQDCAEIQTVRGTALRALGRHTEARAAFLGALALSPDAFEAAESLLSPLAADPDGAQLLELCEQFPLAYANSTLVRGYSAIAFSRAGRVGEARRLVDLQNHPARVAFEPPAEFGGIERFNALLAEEILRSAGLRYTSAYKFYRAEHLAIAGARAFPALAKFLRAAIEGYIAEFPQRGLDVILPPPPRKGFLVSAGNVVRAAEGHQAHLHKYAYISGVYHVSAPPEAARADDRAGALVLGSLDGLADGHVPCWGTRYIEPVPGVATILPSHIFHSVVPTRSEQARIAVPFDLCAATNTEDARA